MIAFTQHKTIHYSTLYILVRTFIRQWSAPSIVKIKIVINYQYFLLKSKILCINNLQNGSVRKINRILLIKNSLFLRQEPNNRKKKPTPSLIHRNRFTHQLTVRSERARPAARLDETSLCLCSFNGSAKRERKRGGLVRRNRCVEKRTSARCKRHTLSRWRTWRKRARVANSDFFDRRCIEKPLRGIRYFGAIKCHRSPPRLIYAFPLSFVPSCFDVHACAVK